MKPNLNLSVPRRCSEAWETFTKSASGGFCSACQKTVVDFTSMSDEAILSYFVSKPAHVCGRFRPDQLRVYTIVAAANVRPGWMLAKAGFIGLLLLLIDKQSQAQSPDARLKIENVEQTDIVGKVSAPSQEHIVRGVVKDESDYPMPGVNIILKGMPIGTTTDSDGQFTFPQKLKEGDMLIFSFIGYTTEEYVVRKNMSDTIAIQCKLDADIMGEVAIDEVYTAKRGLRSWWSKITKHF